MLELTQSAIVKSPATPFDFVLSEFYKEVSQPLNDDLTAIWLSPLGNRPRLLLRQQHIRDDVRQFRKCLKDEPKRNPRDDRGRKPYPMPRGGENAD